jgi:hypothetical protein
MSDEHNGKDHAAERPPLDGVLRIYPPADGVHAAALAEVSRAFARGDIGRARRLVRTVLSQDPSSSERRFAEEIVRRTSIDPVAIAAGVGSFLVLWVVLYLTVWAR